MVQVVNGTGWWIVMNIMINWELLKIVFERFNPVVVKDMMINWELLKIVSV